MAGLEIVDMRAGVQKSNPRFRRSIGHRRRCKLEHRHVKALDILERCRTGWAFERAFVGVGHKARVDVGWKKLLYQKFETIPEQVGMEGLSSIPRLEPHGVD